LWTREINLPKAGKYQISNLKSQKSTKRQISKKHQISNLKKAPRDKSQKSTKSQIPTSTKQQITIGIRLFNIWDLFGV